MLTETPTLPAPTIDGKYRLEALVGEGAYGTVYRALHLDLKKPFALKLLHPGAAADPQLLARFRREAEALGRLRHPAVVEVTDFGIDGTSGSPYLVMELLEGIPLSDHLRAEGPLPLERALPILEAMAGAIDAAHALGVLHRDLKPGNILLGGSRETGGPVVKILDFGLAELAAGIDSGREGEAARTPASFADDARLTSTGALLGTPLYIAPELIETTLASRASDLYSFGVIAYEMLAGGPPFQGTTGEVLAAHRKLEPPPPPTLGGTLPAGAWEALRPALSKRPAERPASAGELVRLLAAAARQETFRRWRAREIPRRLGLALALALPLLAAAALAPNPVWPRLETLAYDLRLRLSTPLPPDPRIVLVTLGLPGPGSTPVPLASRGDEIARAGEAILAAGAKGLAFDLLPPAWWSQSQSIQDLLVRHADRLTLVAASSPAGTVEGSDFVSPLTSARLGLKKAAGMFGFINLAAESDGVIRKGRTSFRTTRGEVFPSWAAHAAAALGHRTPPEVKGFWIDYRVDPSRYPGVALEKVEAEARSHPETFRGRLVIVGGDFQTPFEDRQPIPRRRGGPATAPGIHLQALQVDTLLRGPALRELPARPLILLAALAALAVAALILLARSGRTARGWAVAGLALGLALLALSCALFRWRGVLLPWSPVLAFATVGALLPWGARGLLSKVPSPGDRT